MRKYTMTFAYGPYIVTGEYYPATPDVHYMRNGDPGYPGDSAEFNVLAVTRENTIIPLEVFWPDEDSPEYDKRYTELFDLADAEDRKRCEADSAAEAEMNKEFDELDKLAQEYDPMDYEHPKEVSNMDATEPMEE